MRSASEVQTGTDVTPVALDRVLGVKATVVEPFFVPGVVFIFEIFVFADFFSFLWLIQIFPPN